ncbi:L-threonylcarbamoyladenylate synthase [Paludibacterium purpuratum]|uniref:L-threonylcarbamoyladenylate synthase n=1 Tax=Paludibacterium purpuratum TaxID=1144873 RepID=UPI001AAC64E7|nr:L-threonylcarbamoyladenylate synthase [Paludibacterium purpuratum]
MNPTLTTDIDQACARLRSGLLVAIPTETVYGLAADACNLDAVQKVFKLKRRPASNPLIVHLADAAQSDNWVKSVPVAAERLMKTFWPGPLTLVLPAADHVSRVITAGQGSVALRVPSHPQARELLRRFGGGLVAPSANRYMSISPTSAEHVARQFAGEDLLILDGGVCKVGLESTIVGLLPGEPPRLLRHGMIAVTELEAVLGSKLVVGAHGGLRVPGQHHRHYAPHTPAWRFDTPPHDALADAATAWLWCGGAIPSAGPALDLGADPKAYARALYDALYQLDHLAAARLMIQTPPDSPAWAAVHDRLNRASQPL